MSILALNHGMEEDISMTQPFDAQDNQNRLLHDFHYAAPGARCRTVTFINPNLAEFGHYEWLESECADGRTWDIKTMKATVHGDAPDDIQVQQIYLDNAQGLNFGAMVLKLSDYQKAQEALGYLRDESDLAALAGAGHFRDVAMKQGIAFNENNDPIASQGGLIRTSGTFAITAFAAASALKSESNQLVLPESLQLPTPVAGPPLTVQERKSMTDCMTTLNRIAELLAQRLFSDDLLLSSSVFAIPSWSKSNYTVFVSQFDALMAPIWENKTASARLAQISPELNLFTYQVFKIMGTRMTYNFEQGDTHYSDKKTAALIESARERCAQALETVSPGASSSVLDLFSYDSGVADADDGDKKKDKSGKKKLSLIISRIQAQLQSENVATTPSANLVGIQPDTPWPRG